MPTQRATSQPKQCVTSMKDGCEGHHNDEKSKCTSFCSSCKCQWVQFKARSAQENQKMGAELRLTVSPEDCWMIALFVLSLGAEITMESFRKPLQHFGNERAAKWWLWPWVMHLRWLLSRSLRRFVSCRLDIQHVSRSLRIYWGVKNSEGIDIKQIFGVLNSISACSGIEIPTDFPVGLEFPVKCSRWVFPHNK